MPENDSLFSTPSTAQQPNSPMNVRELAWMNKTDTQKGEINE